MSFCTLDDIDVKTNTLMFSIHILFFRQLAKLDKKQDTTLTSYYDEFVAMCKKICKKATEKDLAKLSCKSLPLGDTTTTTSLLCKSFKNTIASLKSLSFSFGLQTIIS